MTTDQAAAFINAQTALLNCRVAGMVAENQHRLSCGLPVAYNSSNFNAAENEFRANLSENAILHFYRTSA